MLRYAINYLKIVNHKGWVRAPVCLHSTDTKRDFSVGAQGNQKETTKPGKLSDQSLSKPLTDPAKIVTLGSQIKSTPLKENPKVNFASSPPPQSTQPPSSEPPNAGGGDDPNKYRKFIWPLLVAIGALGGVYYFGFHNDTVNVDDSKSKKQKEPKRPIKKIPLHATEIPSHAKYLLIGGGTASFVAFRAIKATDPKAKVLIISGEDAYPYMRPPLSKEIWQYDKLPVDYNQLTFKQWNGRERSLYYEPPEFYLPPEKLDMSENGGVAIATGWYVSRVDAENKKAFIIVPGKEDKEISYEKCLIATGCTPRILPQFMGASKDVEKRTVHFRNIRDLDRLWRKLEDPTTRSVVIIGGGFLGSELACSLGRNKIDNPGRKVLQIFKEPGSMGKALPEYLSKWTSKRVEAEGVEVMADTTVEDVNWANGKVQLRLNENRQVSADLVIVAVGCEPCTALAEVSNLEVDPVHGGFLVNAELEARRDLYVAGDAACFYDPSLGRRRVEHHDHAVVSGRLAGENMASNNPRPYQHQSMFWSDLSPDLGYEAIGLVDASLATVGVFAKATPADTPKENEHKIADGKEQEAQSIALQKETHTTEAEKNYGKGVIFYLKQDKLVGIVLWNVFNRMSIARQVLAQGKTYDDLNEVAKLFKIHEDEEE